MVFLAQIFYHVHASDTVKHTELDANTYYIVILTKTTNHSRFHYYIFTIRLFWLLLLWYIYTGKMAHAKVVFLSCVLIHSGFIVSRLR